MNFSPACVNGPNIMYSSSWSPVSFPRWDYPGIPSDINRHSPDDSRTGVNSSDFLAPWKLDASCGRLSAQQAARTVAEGLIFIPERSLVFGWRAQGRATTKTISI
jgi:hypothetical protein